MATLALIGVGVWGKNYITTAKNLPDCEIKYLCARTDKNLNQFDNTYSKTTDYRELFSKRDIDGVIIATPGSTHYSIASEFARRGYPILVEKPLTTTLKDALRLKSIANKYNSKIMTGHIHLYNPAYLKLKTIIKRLGRIKSLNFTGFNNGPFRDDTSALWDWGPHPVSLFLDLLEKTPEAISAWGSSLLRPKTNLYDTVYLQIFFPKNIVAFAQTSWFYPEKKRELTVIGTKSSITLNDIADKKLIFFENLGPKRKQGKLFKQDPAISYPTYSTKPPLEIEMLFFLQLIKNRNKSPLDSDINVIKVLHYAEKSISLGGKRVKIV